MLIIGGKDVRKAYLTLVTGIFLMLVSVAFTIGPVSATVYSFNLYSGYYSYAYYWWDTAGTRTVTLSVRIDHEDYGWVDVYFLSTYYFNIYTSMYGTIYPILTEECQGMGLHTWTFNFDPVVGAYYYVVIDNTDTWGCDSNYQTYGVWELTSDWAYFQLYGYVTEQDTGLPVADAKISLDYDTFYTFSSSSGYYSLYAPEDTYWAEVSKDGYWGVVNWVTIPDYSVREDWELIPETLAIEGHVYDEVTYAPIEGATVTGTVGTDTTDANGYYFYYGVRSWWTYDLQFSKTGYQTETWSVTLYASVVTLDVYLMPTASAPSAPQNLQATPGNAIVNLNWNAPSSNGGSPITNYKIYRGTTSGGETLIQTVGNVYSYVDTTVTNGVTYWYQVSAVNSVAEGPRSNEASATPVVPEFGSLIFLPLLMIGTLLAVIVSKRVKRLPVNPKSPP